MPVNYKPRYSMAAGWDDKENGWGGPVSQNFCKLDNLIFPSVSSVGTPPAANNVGEQYIDASNNLQTFVNGVYVECAAKQGMLVYQSTDKCFLVYDGTAWVDYANLLAAKGVGGGGTAITMIDELLDVDTTGVTNGQSLRWDVGLGQWVPFTINFPTNIAALSDVSLAGITDGQTLCWNNGLSSFEAEDKVSSSTDLDDFNIAGITDTQTICWDAATSKFIAVDKAAGGGASALNDLSDVDTATTAPLNGDLLAFDGTDWVPAAVAGLGPSAPEVYFRGLPQSPTVPANQGVYFFPFTASFDMGTINPQVIYDDTTGEFTAQKPGYYTFDFLTRMRIVNASSADYGGALEWQVNDLTASPANYNNAQHRLDLTAYWYAVSATTHDLYYETSRTFWMNTGDNVTLRFRSPAISYIVLGLNQTSMHVSYHI